ncbi:hypothetical protein [Chondromyces apiculatus]|nr:hypothetical protein [Chondromyces apiculatus]
MAIRATFLSGFLLVAASLAGCTNEPPNGVVQVAVLDTAGAALPDALAAISEGGLTSAAAAYGARAGSEPVGDEEVPPVPGYFTALLPRGDKGVYVFAEGHQVASAEFRIAPTEMEVAAVEVRAAPMPEDAARPTTASATFSPPAVNRGETATLSVEVTGAENDPISDLVLVISPEVQFSAPFAPPVPEGDARAVAADGTWTAAITPPTEPGSYTYYVVAATTAGMTAPIIEATLIVQ